MLPSFFLCVDSSKIHFRRFMASGTSVYLIVLAFPLFLYHFSLLFLEIISFIDSRPARFCLWLCFQRLQAETLGKGEGMRESKERQRVLCYWVSFHLEGKIEWSVRTSLVGKIIGFPYRLRVKKIFFNPFNS